MEKEEKKPLIILTGPTAVGKTAASIGLAKAVGGEIISADSMQVYKEMDIGSAKITPEEMEGVPHHLVDVLEPEEEFNVVRFQELAKEAMKGIYERGHIPIVLRKMRQITHTGKNWSSSRRKKEKSISISCFRRQIRNQPARSIVIM